MNSDKFGELITSLRKEKSMTQKELADKLHVTDKAVSKWERGKGYPEITLLQSLADVLGITASELLSGERNVSGSMPLAEAEAVVENVIIIADKAARRKISDILFSIFSLLFLTGAFVSLLCNYIINDRFDWSLYPLGALIMTWLIMAPWFLLRRHRLVLSVTAMWLCLFPFLFLVEYLCPVKGWVILLALPIAVLCAVPTYLCAVLWVYTKISRFYLGALTAFLFGVIVNLGCNEVVQNYLGEHTANISVPITAGSFAFLAILLVFIGYIRKRNHAASAAH